MKICIINNLYKPYARGGAEKVVENIVRDLYKKDHEVKIITTRPLFSSPPMHEGGTNIYYIPSLYYNLNKIPKFLRFFWHIIDMFCLRSYLSVKKILKKENPDIVMTHNLKGVGYLVPRAIKFLGIKHIHTLHDIQLLHPSGLMIWGEEKKLGSVFSKVYINICKFLFSSPDVVISPSKWLLDLHLENGFFQKSKNIVLPNPIVGVNINEQEETQREKIFRYLFVGQVEEHKGISFLIKSFLSLEQNNAELVVIGDGDQFEEMKKEKSDKIKFFGRKNREEVAELMAKVDCLVVPSLCYENSPTVIYEAFAVGLPVIASRIGGIPELLSESNLFEAGDVDDLRYKMKWVRENIDELKQKASQNKQRIRELDVREYIEKLLNL